MYKQFFDLKSSPFKLTPDTSCFFVEGDRKAILDGLIYAVGKGDGITKVVGEVGSGKTLLSRLFAQSLAKHFEVLYLLNPRISDDKVLYAIALEMGLNVDYAEDKVRILHDVHNKLLALHQQNKQTILIIDEAQAIPLETLEEIRMLSNLETSHHKLLQIVLFGQPELDKKLNRHEVRQIKERIIHSFYLPRLSRNEINRYLYFRLQKAGFHGVFPFSTLATWLITIKSNGFLRRVNILADKCLLSAFSRQSKKVGVFTALRVIFEGSFLSRFVFTTGVLVFLSLLLSTLNWPLKQPINFTINQSVASPSPITESSTKTLEKIKNIEQPVITYSPQLSIKEKPYSIQLLTVDLMPQKQLLSNIKKITPSQLLKYDFFYTIEMNFFQIYLGHFSSYYEAKNLIDHLPKSLAKHKPFVIKIKNVSNNFLPLSLKPTSLPTEN